MTSVDWQSQSVEALSALNLDVMPAMELIYLDGLAVHLIGSDAPTPPYTIEHGSAIASLLLRAVKDASAVEIGLEPNGTDPATASAREAVVAGAHRLAERGGHGVHQLVTRFLAAAVGELDQQKASPEAQVRALYYYGLLAIASGPENKSSGEIAESVLATFHAWDERIGAGFVPPWRVLAQPSSTEQPR